MDIQPERATRFFGQPCEKPSTSSRPWYSPLSGPAVTCQVTSSAMNSQSAAKSPVGERFVAPAAQPDIQVLTHGCLPWRPLVAIAVFLRQPCRPGTGIAICWLQMVGSHAHRGMSGRSA